MAVTYKGNQIEVSMSNQKFSTDVVYARPEDTIKLDFDLKNVKVTFVNGDVDFIFPDGSIVSLASYGVLAFGSSSPKIYDASGSLVSLSSLLQNVDVLKPEDAVLILANRDKASLVDIADKADKVLEATDQNASADGGNPVAGPGDSDVMSAGILSKVQDPSGTQVGYDFKDGFGDYNNNPINTTNLDKTTNNNNRLPGNSSTLEKSTLVYTFLYGDSAAIGEAKYMNGNLADYYGIQTGTGSDKDPKIQLEPISVKDLGGNSKYKIFDGHSYDGKVRRTLHLDYSGGVFPESIQIYNIPKDLNANGELVYQLKLSRNSTSSLSYNAATGVYNLTQLDGTGKLDLEFSFPQDIPDTTINFEYRVQFLDPKTGKENEIISIQDVGIRSVSQESDLNANQAVLNKGAAGISVDSQFAGETANIFIGGSTGNKFLSKASENLVFTGNGNDIIDLSAIGASAAQSGNNVIYGSTGYDIITGSGSDNDYLVFSNENKYNSNSTFNSQAVKSEFYQTMKKGIALQFYLGMPRGDVLSAWDSLAVPAKNNNDIRNNYTSNFVYSYNSIVVIGDSKAQVVAPSIKNIVGTTESDTFNLYFKSVEQQLNIYGGNDDKIGVGDEIIMHGETADKLAISLGNSDRGRITSSTHASTLYTFDTISFRKFTGSDEDDVLLIAYDGVSNYRSTIYFDGGKGNNTADFSSLSFDSSAGASAGYIEFDANSSYRNVRYYGVKNKTIDYLYNFNKIVGSSGDDLFYGSSSSSSYHFDGGGSSSNTLSYYKSSGGVTYDLDKSAIYKTSDTSIIDFDSFKEKADTFENIQKITLSNYDDVIVGNLNVDASSLQIDLLSGNDTIRYDLDSNIGHIEVDADLYKVSKYDSAGGLANYDDFHKGIYGTISYIGTAGDDIFNGAESKSTKFDGKAGSNTLSYSSAVNSLNFDLSKGLVSKGSYTDSYKNINKIVGGSGNDTFSFGRFDPTNSGQFPFPNNLSIDGGGGTENSVKFNQIILDNLSDNEFALTFDLTQAASDSIVFYDKSGNPVYLGIDITHNIQHIEGTAGNDLFIAADNKSFVFDGGAYDSSNFSQTASNNANIPIYGNTLSYKGSHLDLVFDMQLRNVTKGATATNDHFKNMQGFVGGDGNDIFKVTHSTGDTTKYLDGGAGDNTLDYSVMYAGVTFDLTTGNVQFSMNEYDVFDNINKFVGGSGNDTFILADSYIHGSTTATTKVIIDGSLGTNTLSFKNWIQALGTASASFELKSSGAITSAGSAEYNWDNIRGFIGSDHDDYFSIVDNISYTLDGGLGVDTLTYANLPSTTFTVNVFAGTVLKEISGGSRVYDSIKNINALTLGASDDTVVYGDPIAGVPLANDFTSIDGGKGSNTLDFFTSRLEIVAKISATSISVEELSNVFTTAFTNFSNFNASRKNTTFTIENDSDTLNVTLRGNSAVEAGKQSIIDFTKLQGNVTFYNFLAEDITTPGRGLEAKLEWNTTYTAQIHNIDINQINFNANNNNLVYGSKRNNTFYNVVGDIPTGTTSTLSYGDQDFTDVLNVHISNHKQKVSFVYHGTQDFFEGFNTFVGSNGNDTFFIDDITDVPNDITYDGGSGTNTLSFANAQQEISIDVSLDNIEINNNKINIKHVSELVLGKKNDTVKITNTSTELLFNNMDGGEGSNVIDITSSETLIFNDQGDNSLHLSGHFSKFPKISNFQEIKTSTATGNVFYGSLTNDIKYNVTASTDASLNLLTYKNFLQAVTIDFNQHTVSKLSNSKEDGFAGINYFIGSSARDIFVLDTSFFSANIYESKFSKIYINYSDTTTPGASGSKDTVSLISGIQANDKGIYFNANTNLITKTVQSGEINSIEYVWSNIDTIKFTNDQTIYVSYNQAYNYAADSRNSTNQQAKNAVLSFDKTKNATYSNNTNIQVTIDLVNLTANIFNGATSLVSNIRFSNISEVVATGSSNDIIYGGSNFAIKYTGAPTYSASGTLNPSAMVLPTLSYEKFAVVSEGIKVEFKDDNTATIIKADQNGTIITDQLKYIQTIIGTNGQDTFVLADNSTQDTYQIWIDGGLGIVDTVDLSKMDGNNAGITLNAASASPIDAKYHYSFKNVNSFKMGDGDDTFIGALSNDALLGANSNKAKYALNVDGGGGSNTLDYVTNFASYGAGDNVKINVDLVSGTIAKSGLVNSVSVNSTDRISSVTGTASINFNTIRLQGSNVLNTLTVSDGRMLGNLKVNVAIENATSNLIQTIDFEKLDSSKYTAMLEWRLNSIRADFKDKNSLSTTLATAEYTGFNNITLAEGSNVLSIYSNVTNLLASGAVIRGIGTNNTVKLISDASIAASKVTVDLSLPAIKFDLSGSKYQYQLSNIYKLELGFIDSTVRGADTNDYSITFDINTAATASITYKGLSSAYVDLTITKVDNTLGTIDFSAVKTRGSNVRNTDTVTNAREVTLSDSDDKLILSSIGSTAGKKVIIDGGKGENTVSLESFNAGVNITIDKFIDIAGFELKQFSKIVLTSFDDTIKFGEDSSVKIDGGNGVNTAIYGDPSVKKYISGVSIFDNFDSNGNFVLTVTKKSSQADVLTRFNKIVLPDSFFKHIYNATVVKDTGASNPVKTLEIDFNANNIESSSNTMNYGGLSGANGITAKIKFTNNTNQAEVHRNITDLNAIVDTLKGVNNILGTGKSDVFEVDTTVKNLSIDAIKNGSLRFDYTYDVNNKFFGWNLSSKSVSSGTDATNNSTFLNFNGINVLQAVYDGDTTTNNAVENIFYIYDLSKSYIIQGDAGRTFATHSNIAIDLSNYDAGSASFLDLANIKQNNDGYLEGSITGSGLNNISYNNINNIEGSSRNSNSFTVKMNNSISRATKQDMRESIIRGTSNSDNIKLNIDNIAGKTLTLNAIFDANLVKYYSSTSVQGSSDTFGDAIKSSNISNILIGQGYNNISLAFNKGSEGAYSIGFIGLSANAALTLDFSQFLAAGSSANIVMDLNTQKVMHINAGDLSVASQAFNRNTFNLGDLGTGTLNMLGSVSLAGPVNTYTGVTNINIADGNSAISGDYNNTASAPSINYNTGKITINSQIFIFNKASNGGDININLGFNAAQNKLQFYNILLTNAMLQTVNINSSTTAIGEKSVVMLQDSTAIASNQAIYISTNKYDTVSFGVSNLQGNLINNTINIHNVGTVAENKGEHNYYLKFGSDFAYYSGDNTTKYYGLLQALNIGSTHTLVVDLTDLSGNTVRFQGVSGGTISSLNDKIDYYGLYFGFNGVNPDWNGHKNQVSLEVDNEGFYNNTQIIAPNTGVKDFNITLGFFRGFLFSQGNHRFVVDGSKYEEAKINISFANDIKDVFEHSLFTYSLSFTAPDDNNLAIINNFELEMINNIAHNSYKINTDYNNLHWSVKNVGNYANVDGLDNSIRTTGKLQKSLVLDGGVSHDTYTKNNYNMLFLENSESVDIHVVQGGSASNGKYYNYTSNIVGTIDTFNLSLINYSQISFTSLSTTTAIQSEASRVTFDFFPNYQPVTNGISTGSNDYKSNPNFVFKNYSTVSGGALPNSNYFNQIMDLSNVIMRTAILVDINNAAFVTFWSNFTKDASTTDITPDTKGSSFKAKHFTQVILPSSGATIVQHDYNHQYKVIFSGESNNVYYIDAKGQPSSAIVIGSGFVIKINSTGDSIKDYIYNATTIDRYAGNVFQSSSVDNISGEHSVVNLLIDRNDELNNKGVTYNIAHNHNNFNVTITGIGSGSDHSIVKVADVNEFHITTDNISQYRVSFVDSDVYLDYNGNEKHFDTNGYFTFEDNNTGKFIFFTGEDLSKFSRVFEELLHSKNGIDKFDSYKQMADALEHNKHSDAQYEHKDTNASNTEKEDNSSGSYQNSNHAYVEKGKQEDTFKDNGPEDNSTDNNMLNIVHGEDNHTILDLSASDVLDVSETHSLDNFSKDVFKNIENNNEDHASKESLNSTINSIKEISVISENSNLEISLAVHDNEYNHDDPTSKLDNFLHKENSMNGHNHK